MISCEYRCWFSATDQDWRCGEIPWPISSRWPLVCWVVKVNKWPYCACYVGVGCCSVWQRGGWDLLSETRHSQRDEWQVRSTLAKGSERYFQNKFQQGQINILKILRGLSYRNIWKFGSEQMFLWRSKYITLVG